MPAPCFLPTVELGHLALRWSPSQPSPPTLQKSIELWECHTFPGPSRLGTWEHLQFDMHFLLGLKVSSSMSQIWSLEAPILERLKRRVASPSWMAGLNEGVVIRREGSISCLALRRLVLRCPVFLWVQQRPAWFVPHTPPSQLFVPVRCCGWC